MSIKSFKDLIVWQKSMVQTEKIYKLSRSFPNDEKFGLTSQIKRAAISVPSNIAEGQARRSSKEFKQFLYIAKASNAEVETQLELAYRLEFMSNGDFNIIINECVEISRILQSLVNKIN
jgi:four helix bundle protein